MFKNLNQTTLTLKPPLPQTGPLSVPSVTSLLDFFCGYAMREVFRQKLDTINKLKTVIRQKVSTIGKLRKNEELDLNENHKTDMPETFSSTMSGSSSLRSKSESQYIPFTSGPVFTSMVSHWNSLPSRTTPFPSPIATMVTHCVKSPSKSSSLCTAQEFQEMLDRLVERAFANLRWKI